MMKTQGLKRIARFSLLGAVGFGIGGAVFGIGGAGFRIEPIGGWFLDFNGGSFWLQGQAPWLPGFAILGALGGAALGLALGNWRKVWVLALAGTIGFFVLNIILMLIVSAILFFFINPIVEIINSYQGLWFEGNVWCSITFGAIPGALGGAALGLALLDWKKFIGLALAGSLGFGIGMKIICTSPLDPLLGWVLWGIMGGSALGATLGYLEKKKLARRVKASD
jgi:hypothetical protein